MVCTQHPSFACLHLVSAEWSHKIKSYIVDAKLQACKGDWGLQWVFPALQRSTEIPGIHTERVWYKPALVLHVLERNTEFKLQRFHKRCSQKCAEWKLWNILENRQSPAYKPSFDLRHRLTELFCTRRKKKSKRNWYRCITSKSSYLTAL